MYSTPDEVRLALAPSPMGAQPAQDTAAALSDEQLADAIRQADSRIDGYLAGRYAVPVAPVGSPPVVPGLVAGWSRDLAAYGATLTLYRNRPVEATNTAYLRYLDVMRDLAAVQKGQMILSLPQATSDDGSGGYAGVVNTQPPDLFGAVDFGAPPRMGSGLHWPGGGGRYGGC